LVNIIGEE